MLSMTTYPKDYIDGCQTKVDAHVAAYERLRAAADDDTAADAFEPVFFNNMVVVLDAYFVHRARALELKDGNPLNEVRVMCNSMMQNDDVLTKDKSIKLSPEQSVCRIEFGERIAVDATTFGRLSTAFFDEIRRKYL
jgi:hypothetical protein